MLEVIGDLVLIAAVVGALFTLLGAVGLIAIVAWEVINGARD